MKKLLRSMIINVEIMLMLLFIATVVFVYAIDPNYLIFTTLFGAMAAFYAFQSPGNDPATESERSNRMQAAIYAFPVSLGFVFVHAGLNIVVDTPLNNAHTLILTGAIILMVYALSHAYIRNKQ